MAPPTGPWNDPASITAVGTGEKCRVYYLGGKWVAFSNDALAFHIRTATDPTGTWTDATLPSIPSGYDSFIFATNMAYDGSGTWAVCMGLSGSSGTIFRMLYATDPAGTWSFQDFGAGAGPYWVEGYDALTYGNGTWAVVGYQDLGPSVAHPAFVAACSTITGTWTFSVGSTATGYDITGYGASERWLPGAIIWDGTYWITVAHTNQAAVIDRGGIRTSTSLTSGWSAPTFPSFWHNYLWVLRQHSNGYYTISGIRDGIVIGSPSNFDRIVYATSPTGTWSLTTAGNMAPTYGQTHEVVYTGGLWAATSDSEEVFTYSSTGAPTGTFTAVTGMTLGTSYPYSIATDGTYLVVGWENGPVQWAGAKARRYLRQRQSPRSNPTRVGQVPSLRQRQTFI